jgi:AcrR family transcriptional regulator
MPVTWQPVIGSTHEGEPVTDVQTAEKTPRIRDGEGRRRAIIASATTMLSQRGFHKMRLSDVAAEVGITHAGLLYHFPTKEHLLLAVLQERERARDHTLPPGEMSATTWFIEVLRRNEEVPGLVQLMSLLAAEAIPADHPAHGWFQHHYADRGMQFAENLAEQVDASKLPSGMTVTDLARIIVACADGLRIQWLYAPDSVSRPELLQQLIDLLAPYLRH